MEKLNYSLVSKVEYIEDVINHVNEQLLANDGVPFDIPSDLLRFTPDPLMHDELFGDVTFFQVLEIGDEPQLCFNQAFTLLHVQHAFWCYTNFRKKIVADDVFANRCLNYVIRVLRDCLLNRLPYQYYGILVNSFYKTDGAPF